MDGVPITNHHVVRQGSNPESQDRWEIKPEPLDRRYGSFQTKYEMLLADPENQINYLFEFSHVHYTPFQNVNFWTC